MPVNFVNAPADRGRARHRGRGGDAGRSRAATRTCCGSPSTATASRSTVEGTTIGRDDRLWLAAALGYLIEIELAPLMAFFSYDDMPGRDRPRRHDVRPGRRQHRQHGRVPLEPGRQGADGPVDRHARPRPSSSTSSSPPASTTPASSRSASEMGRPGPSPSQRVTAFLAESGAEVRVEEFPAGTHTARSRPPTRSAAAFRRSSSRSSSRAAAARSLALVPGDRRADTAKIAARARDRRGARSRRPSACAS